MSDIPARDNPADQYERQADSLATAANQQQHQSEEFAAPAAASILAAAQISATLAAATEIRAMSYRVEDALITMLDREPAELRTLDPIEQMLLRGPEQPRPIDKTAVALIGLVVFAVLCVAAAGTVIGLGFGIWSAPFFFGSAFAVAVVAAQSGRRQ